MRFGVDDGDGDGDGDGCNRVETTVRSSTGSLTSTPLWTSLSMPLMFPSVMSRKI